MTKILLLVVAAYLAFRFLTKPRRIERPGSPEVENDVFVEYEEVKDE
ncbi:MAG: hypothetical protein IPL46_10315 [Saprospiraceae bacterium]|nr:hypothetical protein [Saprospiraceae bacterium]